MPERPFENLGISISASVLSLKSVLASAFHVSFLVLSYCISTTLLQILISLRFSIHISKGVHWCSRKSKGIWIFGSIRSLVYWKDNSSKNFCILSTKTSRVESFLSTLAHVPGIFSKSFLEQLFRREPASACFYKTELRSIRY